MIDSFERDAGTLYSFNRKEIEKSWKDFPQSLSGTSIYAGCFGGSYSYKNTSSSPEFYFVYPYMPVWYIKLVDEFNSFYENIHLDIINDKSIYLKSAIEKNDWNDNSYVEWKEVKNDGEGVFETKVPLFSLQFSEEYKGYPRKHVRYVLSIFVRHLCYAERYISITKDSEPENVMDKIIEINNKRREYRSIYVSSRGLSLELLKNFDDIKLVNKALDVQGAGRQTPIINRVKDYVDYNDIGQFRILHNATGKRVCHDYKLKLSINYKYKKEEEILSNGVGKLYRIKRDAKNATYRLNIKYGARKFSVLEE